MQDLTGSDEEVWQAVRHETMDELAQEIGRMCLYWSELEMTVTLALNQLMQTSEPVVTNVLLGAMDLRGKIEALLPLAFHRRMNDHWYNEIEAIANLVNGELRTERNRIIHDSWIELPGRDEPHRMRLHGKVVKTQSRTRELKLADYRPFTPKDVGLLYVKMIRTQTRLHRLMFEHKTFQRNGA
jgi:hypothetical protein